MLTIPDAVKMICTTKDEKVVIRDPVLSRGIDTSPTDKQFEAREIALDRLEQLIRVLSRDEGQHVKELDLSYNKLGQRGAYLIADMLRNNKTLEKISLYGCRLGTRHDFEKAESQPCGFVILRQAFYNHPTLSVVKGLDETNWFTPNEAVQVADFLDMLKNEKTLSMDLTALDLCVDDALTDDL